MRGRRRAPEDRPGHLRAAGRAARHGDQGAGGTRLPIEAAVRKSKGGRLWIVGVDGIKAGLLDKLQRGHGVAAKDPARAMIRFSENLAPVFYEQLTSERRVTHISHGQPVRVFERIRGRRAEALDATVYAIAARAAVNVNLDQRAAELASPVPPAPRRPTVVHSEFMSR